MYEPYSGANKTNHTYTPWHDYLVTCEVFTPSASLLQAEKAQGEIQRSLEETKYSLEARIENLLSEREEVITAVKASEVQMVKESVDKVCQKLWHHA